MPEGHGYSPSGHGNRPRHREAHVVYDSDEELSQSEGDNNDQTVEDSDTDNIEPEDNVVQEAPTNPWSMYKQCCCLKWKFELVKPKDRAHTLQDRKEWYKGPEGLKPNVATKLGDDPFNWFSHLSGCDYKAVACLACHSNEYFDAYIKLDLGPNKH